MPHIYINLHQFGPTKIHMDQYLRPPFPLWIYMDICRTLLPPWSSTWFMDVPLYQSDQENVKSSELFGLYYQPIERSLEYEKETSILSITNNIWKNGTFKHSCSKMDDNLQSHLVFLSL